MRSEQFRAAGDRRGLWLWGLAMVCAMLATTSLGTKMPAAAARPNPPEQPTDDLGIPQSHQVAQNAVAPRLGRRAPTTRKTSTTTRTKTSTSSTRSATKTSTSKTPTTNKTLTKSSTKTASPSTTCSKSNTKSSSSKSETKSSTKSTSQSATRSKSDTKSSSSKTTATTTKVTLTPSLHPYNTLSATCTYIPVPFEVSQPSMTQWDVFNIELVACGSTNATYTNAFVKAAQTWMSIISTDHEDYCCSDLAMGFYGGVSKGTIGFVDDLLIVFEILDIDGVYNILGQAGPYYVRSWSGGDRLPFYGIMKFDVADMARLSSEGTLEKVILHEMGHVLGIGTRWTTFGLLYPSNCKDDLQALPKFLGTSANSTMLAIDPTGSLGNKIPVEEGYGNGTRCAHWDEEGFGSELMTGLLTGTTPISLLTVMSLQDMGYTVDKNSGNVDTSFAVSIASNKVAADGKESKGEPLGDCMSEWRDLMKELNMALVAGDQQEGKTGRPNLLARVD